MYVKVVRLANKILEAMKCLEYILDTSSIGNFEARSLNRAQLISYLTQYNYELDIVSQNGLKTHP